MIKSSTFGSGTSRRQNTNILVNTLGLSVTNDGMATKRFHVGSDLISDLNPPLFTLLHFILNGSAAK